MPMMATTMEKEVLYIVDEMRGILRKYEKERDGWEEIAEDERLRGVESMGSGVGRGCVCAVVGFWYMLVPPVRLWVVDTPAVDLEYFTSSSKIGDNGGWLVGTYVTRLVSFDVMDLFDWLRYSKSVAMGFLHYDGPSSYEPTT
ncbi:hypothetical protein LguiA_022846 [Lonicera macranthoides]